MATGDNIKTATAVAEKCGIIDSSKAKDLALDRKKFNRKVTDVNGAVVAQKLDGIWPRLRVLAGCSPTDKYNLVSKCDHTSRCKEVVAFVGRGTNDVPAMRAADVGIAMVDLLHDSFQHFVPAGEGAGSKLQ
jgi:Ca2+ transporting ATPase